ncbi:cox cluster protein [Halobacteriales archaeon QS_6_64_34]|nr:MAG: cox cluster protein [Halobacteriales archaeon QS_6_64_34]
MTDEVAETAGEKVVVQIYVIIVALAGVMGFVLGTIRPNDLQPALFGVIALPPTPFGVALYGMVTIAIGLGVLLGLVIYVSRRTDAAAGRRDPR